MIKNKKKPIVVFAAHTAYTLFSSIYYAIKLRNYCDCVLIYKNIYNYDVNEKIFSKYFYKVFRIEENKVTSNFALQLSKIVNYGWLRYFSQHYNYLNNISNFIFICYGDHVDFVYNLIEDFKKKAYIILAEEGIGIYSLKPLKKMNMLKKISDFIRGYYVNYKYIGLNNNISAFFVKEPLNFPKIKSKGKIVIKQNNIFNNKTFSKLNIKIWNNFTNQIINKKIILYLGSPINEIGLDEKQELKFLIELSKKISNEYKILIKRHPREKMNKYDSIVNDKIELLVMNGYDWLPIELLGALIKPKIIVSVLSSAPYNMLKNGLKSKIIYIYKYISDSFNEKIFENQVNKYSNVYSIKDIHSFIKCMHDNKYLKKPVPIEKNKNMDIVFLISMSKNNAINKI